MTFETAPTCPVDELVMERRPVATKKPAAGSRSPVVSSCTQWPAVNTSFGETTVPVQLCDWPGGPWYWTYASSGNDPVVAGCPPTIWVLIRWFVAAAAGTAHASNPREAIAPTSP